MLRGNTGQILAVACSDGTVSLINAFTGKIAHKLSTAFPSGPSPRRSANFDVHGKASKRSKSTRSAKSITEDDLGTALSSKTILSSMAWTTHFAYPTASTIRQKLDSRQAVEKDITLDHILSLKADVTKLLALKADLPRELSAIDVETSLPKLATLPPIGVGSGDDVFSTRGSVDAVFHSNSSGAAGSVDVLIVGMHDGTGDDHGYGRCAAHIKIFDSFEIGSVDVDACLRNNKGGGRVISLASHPYLSAVFMVVEQEDNTLSLVSLDLSFIQQTGRNLSLVARKATQLGNLLRYVSQVQMQLSTEVKAAFDLPTRFLRNINESLSENDQDADFAFAAHHLAVTGECNAQFKEWLVDEVGERGLKRWEKAVGDCLEVVRRLTSECLSPALERIQVVLSRLHGLASFSETKDRLGLSEVDVRKARETVDVLSLLGEDLLVDVGKEIKEFAAFMRWMKWECEVEALEEGSERAEELRESWAGEQAIRTVLDYVGSTISETRLKRYIDTPVSAGEPAMATRSFNEDVDAGFYIDYTTFRNSPNKQGKPPMLGELLERFRKQCDVVFGQIAENFRKSILATYMVELPLGFGRDSLDIRIVPDEEDTTLQRMFICGRDTGRQEALQMVQIVLQKEGSKALKFTSQPVDMPVIPQVQEIMDMKFVDDSTLLALVKTETGIEIHSRLISDEGERVEWEVRHVFEEGKMEAGMTPGRLEVNGRVGRRVVAILDRTGMGYVVLDLDASTDSHDEAVGQDLEDEVMTG